MIFLKEPFNYILDDMKTGIIKIGNSRGLRLSKTILEKYNIGEEVELK